MKFFTSLLTLLGLLPVLMQAQPALVLSHSHNDYEQKEPFHHAYKKGFSSIEADVYLVDGKLLVAHDLKDVKKERSLEKIYLAPLSKAIAGKENPDRPGGAKIQLLIDIKSEAIPTLEALVRLLKKYPSLTSKPSVTITISGNRPSPDTYHRFPAWISFDGRPGISYDPAALKKISLISDSYSNYLLPGSFRFDSIKAMKTISAAHEKGKPFRFWGNPDNPSAWRSLANMGVDYLNTDKIDELSDFLISHRSEAFDQKLLRTTLHDSIPLMPYNRIIRSAGKVIRFGNPALENHALDITRLEGTELVVVEDRYGILVIDTDGKIIDRFTYADAKEFGGIVSTYSGIETFTEAGKIWIVWSAAGGMNGLLMSAQWDGKIRNVSGMKIDKKAPARNAIPNDIAVDRGADPHLYIVLNGNDELMKIRWSDRQIVWKAATGVAPYGVTIANNKVYVTNWAGPQATDSTKERAGTPWGLAYTDALTGATAYGSVSVLEPNSGKLLKEVKVGLHPNAIITSRDGRYVYLSNGNSDDITVINTRNDQVVETIPVGLFGTGPGKGGSTPNGISLDPTGQVLYVSNGMDNAVALVRLGTRSMTGGKGQSMIKGYIPTEAYPAGSLVMKDRIIVANLESEGVNVVNAQKNARGIHYQLASVSIIPIPDEISLGKMTEDAFKNALQHRLSSSLLPPRKNMTPVPVPERIGEPSVFKHVVYIIKENKTYDQVFGDMSKGRGDSTLCVFGKNITPNTHALAEQYGWMDNYYASGKSSAEGHQWSNAAIVSDYVEKNVRAWFRSYPHRQEDAMVYNKTGYIWNHAMAYGKTVRIFGEACLTVYDKKLKWIDLYRNYQQGKAPDWHNVTTIAPIRPVISPDFPDNDNMVFSDQQRADIFLKEWDNFEKGDSMPNLMIVSLPNDHTAGLSPDFPTPAAMVADNDLALGRILEKITNSRYFDSTVIFITQDDSQSGWDHISGYRTVGLVVSPFGTGDVITTQYNQTSMVRTIEQILGIPPMHGIDATASPMFDCFSKNKHLIKYRSLAANIPLDQMNKPLTTLKGREKRYALQSMDEVYNEVDGGEDGEMNRIIWFATKGRKKFPTGRPGK
jgi:YVTN family beta-propeller protein